MKTYKRQIQLSLQLTLLILVQACNSLAPFASEKSGTTLGKGHSQIVGGASPFVNLIYSKGFTDDLDVSFILEDQELVALAAVSAKYSFRQSEKGIAYAATMGVFSGIQDPSYGFFLGPIISYKHNSFEFYAHFKYNYVETPRGANIGPDDSDFFAGLNQESYIDYGLGILGASVELNRHWAINLNTKLVVTLDSDDRGNDSDDAKDYLVLPLSFNVMYRF